MSLISELRRRNVFRMAALYVVAAWLVMQVGEVIIGLASLPDWVGKALLAILAIGFPIALILAWLYEVTPEGLKPESEVDRSKSITTITGRRMDFIIIAVLTAALLVFAYDKWWQPETEAGPPAKSVAVLPFVNMTADDEKEYLSDGIAEELIGLLAAIPELTVMSRSSAFALKGQNIEVPEIGRRLNVAHIVEGSVRSTGDQLKIHVQLIDSKTDAHLWAETFEGTMDDVFTVQDEIASRVVDQLKVTLLGEKPRTIRTHPETYVLLLKARFLWQQSTIDTLREAEVLLRQALALDSKYVPAWIALSGVYLGLAMAETQSLNEIMDLAEHAARKALELDPASGAAHARLGWIAIKRHGDYAKAARHYEQALAANPPGGLANSASLVRDLGRFEQAIAIQKYDLDRDPLNPIGHYNLALTYLFSGQLESAKSSLIKVLTLSPDFAGGHYTLGLALLFSGDAEDALNEFKKEPDEFWRPKGLCLVYSFLGDESKVNDLLSQLEESWGELWPVEIAHVYAYRGEIDKAFEWISKDKEPNFGVSAEERWMPFWEDLRGDPRWEELLQKAGVADSQLNAIKFEVSLATDR